MANEKLPIKFFASRDVDNQHIEAGGGGDDPQWVFSGDELKNHAQRLSSSFKNLTSTLAKQERKSPIPLTIKAKFVDDAKAKSHRKEIRNLFELHGRNNVIGLVEPDEVIIKIESSDHVSRVNTKLDDYERNNYAISCLSHLESFTPNIVISSKETENYKLKLIDFQDYEQNVSIRNILEQKLIQINIRFNRVNYSNDLVIYSLDNLQKSSLDMLSNEEIIEAVFSIEPMPRYKISLDQIPNEKYIEVLRPDNTTKYVKVGFLDNGIAQIPHLKPWLLERWSPYPNNEINPYHGTPVSGVAIYGDVLESANWSGNKGFKILDAVIYPDTNKEGLKEDELINNIREAVKKYSNDIKIWNLCISIPVSISENNFSDFAVALDAIQDESNVLICKSTGNCDNFMFNAPKSRIFQGADSVRSLVVGSITHKKGKYDLVDVDQPSPFSPIGPGPSYIIKPEITHYGGNAGLDSKGNLTATGINSFSSDGSIIQLTGTSFSTPRITALAAGIYQEIDEEFDPLLIKGLIIHSAEYPSKLAIPEIARTKYVGFGKPKSVKDIIYNSPNEVTLVLRDSLKKGEKINIMDFPMPDCMVEDGYFHGQIILTLIYDPILVPSQRAEYCQSNIDVKMGTYDNKFDRDTTKKNIINPIGREGSKNILLESLYDHKKMSFRHDDFAMKERLLIKYADKYYPVKKYGVDLDDIRDNDRIKYLTDNKKWFLSLTGLYRDYIENTVENIYTTLNQDLCLIITIKDKNRSKSVYDGTVQKLNEYNFWHNNIKIRGEVKYNI
jgi:hypothetical protein